VLISPWQEQGGYGAAQGQKGGHSAENHQAIELPEAHGWVLFLEGKA